MTRAVTVPREHQDLAASLGVTDQTLAALARFCEGPLLPLQPHTERDVPIHVPDAPPALMMAFRGSPIDTHVWELDAAVSAAGLTVFQCAGRSLNSDGAWERRRLALLRRGDPWDPLRAVGTAAPRWGIDSETMIRTLAAWDSDWRFRLRGAGPDWVELYCGVDGSRLKDLADIVYQHWPKLVRSGHGSRAALLHQLETLACLWLFWRREA